MCVIHWRPETWEWEVPSPPPRPLPRLAWATPVDIVELGSSIEAYERQLPAITALRLCHRFGDGPLSQLPQEILDQVVSEVHEGEEAGSKPKWERNHACFQGICTTSQHLSPELIEEIWDEVFVFGELLWDEEEAYTDPDSYSTEEKASMVMDYVDRNHIDFDDWPWETHDTRQDAWVDLLCTCERPSVPKVVPAFARLNKLLKNHFGVEAIVLHEVLSSDLQHFLPFDCKFSDCSYHTSGFLALAAPEEAQKPTRGRGSTDRTGMFLKNDNHLAFHQTLDPAQLILTEKQRLRFARALRILGLQPQYHVSELESSIIPSTKDDAALWAICDKQLPECPAPLQTSEATKQKALRQYVHSKNKELAKRSWPQLMHMATSDAVVPTYR